MTNQSKLPPLLGIDIVQIDRIKSAIERSGDGFLSRLLTPAEYLYIGDINENIERIAGIWAGKEAAVKALGTGFRLGITFHDIQINHDEFGAPFFQFSGQFYQLMQGKLLSQSALSISHCRTYAIAATIFN